MPLGSGLVYGDCEVIPDPTADELADIAVASAGTARRFGVDPRVPVMLSYSTGDSGTGADVEKVRSATELVRRRCPELAIEGPLQYDAAVDACPLRRQSFRAQPLPVERLCSCSQI